MMGDARNNAQGTAFVSQPWNFHKVPIMVLVMHSKIYRRWRNFPCFFCSVKILPKFPSVPYHSKWLLVLHIGRRSKNNLYLCYRISLVKSLILLDLTSLRKPFPSSSSILIYNNNQTVQNQCGITKAYVSAVARGTHVNCEYNIEAKAKVLKTNWH